MNEKSYYMRLQELKYEINRLLNEWKTNANFMRPRTGNIYQAMARDLERMLRSFEKRENAINYIEVK